MEIIDSQSTVKTVFGTAAVDVCPSLLSFQEFYYKDCYLNTPPDNNTQVLSFSVPPSIASELVPRRCLLEVKYRCLQSDNTPMSAAHQVGAIQG